MVIFVDTPKPNAAEMNRFLIPRSRKDPALIAVRRGGETETRFGFLLLSIEQLKSSDQQTVPGSWPSGDRYLHSEPGCL